MRIINPHGCVVMPLEISTGWFCWQGHALCVYQETRQSYESCNVSSASQQPTCTPSFHGHTEALSVCSLKLEHTGPLFCWLLGCWPSLAMLTSVSDPSCTVFLIIPVGLNHLLLDAPRTLYCFGFASLSDIIFSRWCTGFGTQTAESETKRLCAVSFKNAT